jgi:carbonic anhydrase/acetyltransferase-like protein (isoleucine patch superfamily)
MKIPFLDKIPKIHPDAFVAEDANVIGDVTIDEEASVFFHSTLRGDSGKIIVGKGSNIQDGCILHCDEPYQVIIKENVTIGHGAIVHGATIESECLIGMGAIILNGAHLLPHTMVAAGALIKEGMITQEGYLYAGVPAKPLRPLTLAEIEKIKVNAKHYQELSKQYQEKVYGTHK